MAKKKQKSVLLKVAVAVDEAGALSVNTNEQAFGVRNYDATVDLDTDGMIGSINIYTFEVPLMLPVTKKIKSPKVKKVKTIEPKQDAAEVNEPWKP